MRSFRTTLALGVALQALVLVALVLAGAALLLRITLLRSIDASLLEIAQVETQIGNAQGGAAFAFHEFPFPPGAGASSPRLTRWAQLLSDAGTAVARSRNLDSMIPVPSGAFEAARRGEIAHASHVWRGQRVRSLIYPMALAGPQHAGRYLQVTRPLEPLLSNLAAFLRGSMLLAVGGAVLAWLFGHRVAGRALQPALEITRQAEVLGVNELDRRVVEPTDTVEFHRLAVAVNSLLERIERAVTGTRRFTSDASHELRAPLTVLRGELELALSRPRSTGEYEEVMRRCLDEVLRLARLADDLLTLTRVEGGVVGGKRTPTELDDVVARALEKKAGLAAARGVSLTVSGNAGLVLGDLDLLVRAVDGLLEHAIMASPRGGEVRVALSDGAACGIVVTDSGPGVKDDEISGVFQRFYRSNRPRVASMESGLGLPIARAVAQCHGGTLDYAGNDPGASFKFTLPAA
ncbi:MAG: hypothetical protein HOP28_14710 [Gemmatimonadales bacterium]|nr:hypothetical protein [Gemmatimonadales bacterium]